MSSDKKRKSGDAVAPAAKKAKTVTVDKSADRPKPLKSALKKAKVETVVEETPKEKKSKTKSTVVNEPKKAVSKVETVVVEEPKDKKSKAAKATVDKTKEKKTKATKKPVIEEPVQADDDEEDAIEGDGELTADQTAALLAGFSSDEESDAEQAEEGIALDKLPTAPVAKKADNSTSEPDAESTPGVIYISRIPHGFFEKQMSAYFSQFGTITNLRLARNRKTGKSKHHAFIEFESTSVADIVAKTMDKYLLFGHILQVRRVPQEQVKEGIWKGPRSKVAPKNRLEGARLKRGVEREAWERRITREEKRRSEKADKLKEIGYEFEMPSIKSISEVPVKDGAAIEEPEGVHLIEGKKSEPEPTVEEKVETVVEDAGSKVTVTQEKKIKRKSKDAAVTTTTKRER